MDSSLVADYVLVFDTSVNSPREKTPMPNQYLEVVNALKQAGLHVTARPGAKGTETVLLLVRATPQRLFAEIEDQARVDFIKSVHSPRANMLLESATQREIPLAPADRLMLVNHIISSSQERSTENRKYAGVSEGTAPFDRVKAIFPPHDAKWNAEWLRSWSTEMSLIEVKPEELDRVASHFGPNVAMYFAFLRAYFASLVPPSVFGFLTWIAGNNFSPFYSFAIVLWSVCFVEWWRIKERMLSIHWGTYNASLATPRGQFKGTVQQIDPVSGNSIKTQPWHVTELRVLSSVPIIFVFAALLIAVISGVFTTEVLLTEVYDGPFQSVLKFLPIMLFVGIVPQVINYWYGLARKLCDYENHETEAAHERSLTLKMFTLNAIAGYGNLFLSAYVYIPFGTYLVPKIVSYLDNKHAVHQAFRASKYSVDGHRLVNTLFALNTTTQLIGNVNETLTPWLLRKYYPKKKEERQTDNNEKKQLSAEDAYLEQLQKEATLPQYELFGDYAEMAQQFGYVVLWSSCWPLVPLTSLINNFFELRGDAFKIVTNERRPIPKRSGSIGPWLDVLSFITWAAAFTNATLCYMYMTDSGINETSEGQAAAHNATMPAPANRLAIASRLPDADSNSILRALFSAFLIGLACEHLYVGVRAGIRHVFGRWLWEQSPEAVAVAKQEYSLRRQALGKMDDNTARPTASPEAPSPFWQVDPLDELQRYVKEE